MASILEYKSYAKINLYLDVINRRDDGYHNLETIFQGVDLADHLTFTLQETGITMTCSSPDLETGEDNLVHRAATILQHETGCRSGVHVELDKRIPVAAGLAGGSGNAAATLAALNNLWSLAIDDDRLLELALELGSDVPYCLAGGTMAATGRGEIMTSLKPIADTWFVLVHPPMAVSTSRVFNSPHLRHNKDPIIEGRTTSFSRALEALENKDWPRVLFNTMEEAVFHDYPKLADMLRSLKATDCAAAVMSGTGSTLFAVCNSHDQAKAAATELSDFATSVVKAVPMGVERIN